MMLGSSSSSGSRYKSAAVLSYWECSNNTIFHLVQNRLVHFFGLIILHDCFDINSLVLLNCTNTLVTLWSIPAFRSLTLNDFTVNCLGDNNSDDIASVLDLPHSIVATEGLFVTTESLSQLKSLNHRDWQLSLHCSTICPCSMLAQCTLTTVTDLT